MILNFTSVTATTSSSLAAPSSSTAFSSTSTGTSATSRFHTAGGPIRRSRHRVSSHDAALELYERVVALVLSSDDPLSQREALLELDIPRRTFERKRRIAELMIIDRSEFDALVARLAATGSGRMISQEKLSGECEKILDRPAMKIQKRLLISRGRVI